MTDNLPLRLRETAHAISQYEPQASDSMGALCIEAAALIEQLVSALEASGDILERYIDFLHHMPVSEIELHPYIPTVEEAFDNTRAALSQARGEQP